MQRWLRRAGLAALVILGIGLNSASLTTFPPPHCDEAYYASMALEAIRHGRFGSPVMGPTYHVDETFVAIGRLFSLGLGVFLKVLGLSLRSARVFVWLGWLIAITATYRLAHRLYGHRSALWGALIFALSWKTFYASHIARPEIWLAAGVGWSLYWMLAEPPRRITAGVAGLIGALNLDIHFNGAYFLVGLTLVALYLWWWRGRQWHLLLAFASGVALGLVAWAALHFLPDPMLAWYQWRVGYTRMGMGIGSVTPLASIADFGHWVRENFWSGNRGLDAVESLIYVVGLYAALARRRRSDLVVLLMLGGAAAAFIFLMPQKLLTYRVLWLPYLAVLGAEGIGRLSDWLLNRWVTTRWLARYGMAISLGPVLALMIAGSAWLVWLYRDGRYTQTMSKLVGLVPPATVVLGDPIWWFGFQADHRYVSDFYIVLFASEVTPPLGQAVRVQHDLTDAQVRLALRSIQAEYVILDPLLHCMLTETYPPNLAYRDYVSENCQLVGEVTGAWYDKPWGKTHPLGEISQVYRCG